jgi:hypothetical protein
MSDEPILTIRQPRASATFLAAKDIENRKRRTHYRGRLWIHAGKHVSRAAPDQWAKERGIWLLDEPLTRGAIIGCVDLVDCVRDSDSLWALPNCFHWILARPRLLVRPVPATGSLRLEWRRPPQGRLVRARRSRRSQH